MALTETQQTKASVKINHVPTDADVQTLFNNGSFNPGEIIVTPDEDVNLDCLRTEIVYDKNITDKNWGYPNGILGGTTVSGKDFSNYNDLKIYIRWDDQEGIEGILHHTLQSPTPNLSYTSSCIYPSESNSGANYKARTIVNSSKTSLTLDFIGYTSSSGVLEDRNNYGTYYIYKIEGILKTPAMIYTGEELNAGNGVTLDNGTVAVTDKVLGVPSNNNWIDVSVTNNSNVTYTAPANGYLMVQGAAASTSMCRVLLFNVTNSANDVLDAINGQGCYAYNSDNTMMGTTICKKGDVVKIYITNLKDIRARFVPSEV